MLVFAHLPQKLIGFKNLCYVYVLLKWCGINTINDAPVINLYSVGGSCILL